MGVRQDYTAAAARPAARCPSRLIGQVSGPNARPDRTPPAPPWDKIPPLGARRPSGAPSAWARGGRWSHMARGGGEMGGWCCDRCDVAPMMPLPSRGTQKKSRSRISRRMYWACHHPAAQDAVRRRRGFAVRQLLTGSCERLRVGAGGRDGSLGALVRGLGVAVRVWG
jgi:hypothetical protein